MKEEQVAGMSKKNTIILAVVFSVFAFLIFRVKIAESKRTLIKDYGDKVTVIFAKSDILPGTQIEKNLLETREIPSLFVQPCAIKSLDECIGRVAQTPVKEGEQLMETKLVQTEGGYLSLRVGTNDMRRAITLKMDGEGGLAGLAKPGDLIDVIGVFESTPENADSKLNNHAIVIVQAVRVLAVDNRLSAASSAGPVSGDANFGRATESSGGNKNQWLITIDVEASEAWKLSLAAQVAHLRCVLRYRTNDKPFRYDLIEPAQLKNNTREIKSGDVFGASGKTIWPSGQPTPGQGSYSEE